MRLALSTRLQSWAERIDAMELRERILLLAAAVAVMYLLIDTLILQPTLKAQKVVQSDISSHETKLGSLRRNAELYADRSQTDPLQPLRESRNSLAGQLAELDARIVSQLGALVEPAQAAKVLEQILDGHPRLRLATLSASTEALETLDLEARAGASGLARYRVNMVVKGGYLELLEYLESLEAMPWKFFWQQVEFQSGDYPQAETRIQLYTLGAQGA